MEKDPTELAATAGPDHDSGAPVDPSAPLGRGHSFDKYMILDKVGEGGMGVVYAAYDTDLDRKVALKLLRKSQGGVGSAARARLLREAQAMAKLTHPNVITVYDVGTVEDRDFIAMEFVDGPTLDQWTTEDRSQREVVEVFTSAGRGLEAAHRAGLIHRDFKPANVLVGVDGRAQVTDFGLARQQSDDTQGGEPLLSPRSSELTATGAVMGTPAYMAPEQYQGRPVDARSDQFSFCVALYEALHGARPFEGDSFEELKSTVVAGRIRAVTEGSSIPSHARSVIQRGLRTDPEARYPSMTELLVALQQEPVQGNRRGPLVAVLGAVVAAAVLFVVVTRSAAPGVCDGAERNLEGIWDSQVRAQLGASFAATKVRYASPAFERFSAIVDDYAAAWAAEYTEACEATHVTQQQSAEDLLLRQTCLEGRRADLKALTAAFAEVESSGIERAVEAAYNLPSIAECGALEALRLGVEPPADADTRAAVTELRRELAEADKLGEAGRSSDAIELGERVLAASREVGYRPLLVEALVQAGQLYLAGGRVRDAEAALREAELLAEETGYDAYRAKALVEMTGLLAGASSRFDEARQYGRRALAALRRAGRDPEVRVDLELYMATLLIHEHDVDEALARVEKARWRYELSPERKPTTRSRLLEQLGDLRMLRGELTAACGLLGNAAALAQEELGAEHPITVARLASQAACLHLSGQYEQAAAIDARMQAYWSSEQGQQQLDLETAQPMATPGHRTARLRVVDRSGTPVRGAKVVLGLFLQIDGASIVTSLGRGGRERTLGIQRGTTNAAGLVTFSDIAQEDLVVVAEHDDHGRSHHQIIDELTDEPELVLQLEPFGELRGSVNVLSGKRRLRLVAAVPLPVLNPPSVTAVVGLGQDGIFHIPRLAPGEYEVLLQTGAGARSPVSLQSQKVTISSGEVAEVAFDTGAGSVTLAVEVHSATGVEIPSAQLVLFGGEVTASNVAGLRQQIIGNNDVWTSATAGGAIATINGLAPGDYSLCVVPFDGDHRDPEYARSLQDEFLRTVPVHCSPVQIDEEPRQQSTAVTVAPMPPAPKATPPATVPPLP